MNTHKQIKVVPYNPEWPHMFAKESTFIKQVLGEQCVAIHHIGSTAVPGLSAKQDLDILCIVDNLAASLVLQNFGFLFKGELNIPLRYFFSKNTECSKVNLHVVEIDHGFIALQFCFRDYLRVNEAARLAYAELKMQLLKDPASYIKTSVGFTGYSLWKNAFIKNVLVQAGFNGVHLNFCLHDNEWAEYHRICAEQIYMPRQKQYVKSFASPQTDDRYCFVLYKGAVVVSVAQIELLNNQAAALRRFATDKSHQNLGYGTYLIQMLELWLKLRHCLVLKLHTDSRAEQFYRKLGYHAMPFIEPNVPANIIDLGKVL